MKWLIILSAKIFLNILIVNCEIKNNFVNEKASEPHRIGKILSSICLFNISVF